jgi:hypothetical protein
MSSLFSTADYARLAEIVFRPDYPGNATARGVVEAPNGDGKLDVQKKYAHVATKYLDQYNDPHACALLNLYLADAHWRATELATALGVPDGFMPSFDHGALRVLEYPAGAGSEMHTDVGLFTINCYRNEPNAGLPNGEVHMGRIAREIGLCKSATPHQVLPSVNVQQSIVYFAVPDHEATLPSGERLGTWLDKQMAKMRYDATPGKGGPG